jgi:cytochrome c556
MDRKRPQTDDSSLKSPPGKILKTEIDDSMDISKNEDINKLITLDAPDDYLLAYQKEAIWRRMESYKGELAKTKERVNKLQNREQKHLDKFMILGKYWIKIEEEINFFLSKIDNKDSALDIDKIEFLKKLYQSEDDEKKLDIFEKLFINYFNKIKSSLDKILEKKIEKPINEKELINKIEKQNKISSDNAITYQAKFEKANTKISDLEEQINDLKVQITILENKLNKKKCLTTSAKYSTLNKDSAIGHSYSNDGKGDVNIVKLNEELNVKSLLSEKRLEEIKNLEAEKLRLNNEINEYKKQLIDIPEEQIIDSSLYKSLQIQCGYLKSEADSCKAQLEKLTREYEALKADRQAFMDQLEQEDHNRRKALLSDIRKLEQEKTKLHSEKESLQQALELRNSKDQTEIYQNHEIRVIANTRKDRIICLEKQIQRLRMKMATDAGDKELLEMHDDATAEEIIDRLRKQIDQQKKELEEKSLKLKSYETIPKNENEQHEIILSNEHLKKEMNQLKDKIKQYEKIYGITENPNTEKAVRDMAKKIKGI